MVRATALPRRGSLYLSVLGASAIVGVLALAGMRAARVHLQATTAGASQEQAQLLAKSAIELGIAQLNADPNWSTSFMRDVPYPSPAISMAGGTFSWLLRDAGGVQPVLQGTGRVGNAVCTLEVELSQPPDLECGLLVGGDLTVNADCSLTCEGAPVCTNGTFQNQGATTADVEAQSIVGVPIVGIGSDVAPQRVLPNASEIFEYYESVGTPITPPDVFGTTVISLDVISPNEGIGATNSDGIYVVDTRGNNLDISSSRIVGTLVVTNLDPGMKVKIDGDINWEPAYPNYPALLVDGDVEIEIYSNGKLSESFLTPSYNPVGTPYQGQQDSDKNDEYPSSIAGIIYCTGNLEIDGSTHSDRFPDLRGQVIVEGNCLLSDRMHPTITYDPLSAMDPPPGFGVKADTQSATTELKSYSGSGSMDDLLADKWWAQYFVPSLPAEATSWRITRAEFYCRKGTGNRDLEVVIYAPDGSNMPSTIIDSVAANSNDFSSSVSWQGVDFTGTATIAAGDGVCLALTTNESNRALEIEYLSGGVVEPNSALICGNPAWGSYEPDKALLCRVYGVYYTSSGSAKPIAIVPGSWRQVESVP